ncbi:hypothetical protein Q3G72_017994 [Acer saccharum]|nr:hypothetical protein Q3G72_017994 [Acer saccharum]
MSLTIPTNLSKTILKPLNPKSSSPSRPLLIQCSASQSSTNDSPLKAFSAALALSSILLSAPLPAVADISGLTPCKESKQFAKREKQSLKKLESSLKLYAPDSAPALAIKATMEKTKRRFDNYGKQGLLCGADGLPHLIVSGDQRHWGEFITPGILFLYIAVWSSEVSAGLLLLTESSSMVILLSRTSNSSADQTMRGRQRKKSKCGGNDIECLNWEFVKEDFLYLICKLG